MIWREEMGTQFGHSCDAILDLELPEPDTLRNFVEEKYGTNPRDADSDGDLIDDLVEISTHLVDLESFCGRPTFRTLTLPAPHIRGFLPKFSSPLRTYQMEESLQLYKRNHPSIIPIGSMRIWMGMAG